MKTTSGNKILLNRLAYFFKHFKPDQKKVMNKSLKEFFSESKKTAETSKSLYKILDYFTTHVFHPIKKLVKMSQAELKRRREKMKPSLLLLYNSPKTTQKKYQGYLQSTRTRSRSKRSY